MLNGIRITTTYTAHNNTQNVMIRRKYDEQIRDFLIGDSRSLLVVELLRQMDMDAVFLVSARYSHALAAFVSDHPGHSFSHNGKDYLMGDTTAPGAGWGMIDPAQDDVSGWIFVDFP